MEPVSTSSGVRIDDIAASALLRTRMGQIEQANKLWKELLAVAPEHPQALFHLGQHALYARDLTAAQTLLERAVAAEPKEPAIALNLSFVYRAKGDAAAELGALSRALSIDPYFYPALLAKGMLLERTGDKKQAARTYKDVLTIAPAEEHLPPDLKAPMKHARIVVDENAAALSAYLNERLAPIGARHGNEKLSRFEECRDVALGRKKIYTQQPSMLHFPGLPATQFYDEAMFPWLATLEAATDVIRDELAVVLKEDTDEMRPYVAHPDGAPIDQWAELNHSPRWSVFFLLENGVRNEKNCARCPRTVALLDHIPMMDLEGFGPTVMFSILAPHTHIPPHSSVTNARLVTHLPLIAPDGCRFRVGNETREWKYGKAWVFDDTIDHEAWNDSDYVRVILMIDIWNPHLTKAERELVTGLLNGIRDYYQLPIPRP
jgi:aspartyl/asparaginyl beta-hydroxylase (cupin superfamily)